MPLLVTAAKPPPPGYRGDFYVDEFTDAKLKERWAACKADAACFKRINAQMQRWLPPNKERATRVTGMVDPVGKIEPDGQVDLRQIRKPGFFAKAPYHEAVAEADGRTHVVEFTVPRDPLERLKLNMHGDIKLRGWYVEGVGVDDGRGGRTRALVIMSAGGGGQLTAIQHPADVAVRVDPATRRATSVRYPNATTEGMGMRIWRDHLHALNRAGFDVLAYDRRGEGLSGGFSDTNTLEQSEDIFRVLEQMERGRGLRLLTPRGELLEARAGRRPADGRPEGAPDSAAAAGLLARLDGDRLGHDEELRRRLQLRPAARDLHGAQGLYQHQGRDPLRLVRQRGGLPAGSPRPGRPQPVPGRHGGRQLRGLLSELGRAREHAPLAGRVLRQGLVGPRREPGGNDRRLRPRARPEGDRRRPRASFDGDVAAAGSRPRARPHGGLCRGCRPRAHAASGCATLDEHQGSPSATTPDLWEPSSQPQ